MATTGNLTGKRYRCAVCSTLVMCVKAGAGTLHCHGAPMDVVTAKPLPSSD